MSNSLYTLSKALRRYTEDDFGAVISVKDISSVLKALRLYMLDCSARGIEVVLPDTFKMMYRPGSVKRRWDFKKKENVEERSSGTLALTPSKPLRNAYKNFVKGPKPVEDVCVEQPINFVVLKDG